MEKDAAGYLSLLSHYRLTNSGTRRTSPAAYPTSRPVLRGRGGRKASPLPDCYEAKTTAHPSGSMSSRMRYATPMRRGAVARR